MTRSSSCICIVLSTSLEVRLATSARLSTAKTSTRCTPPLACTLWRPTRNVSVQQSLVSILTALVVIPADLNKDILLADRQDVQSICRAGKNLRS